MDGGKERTVEENIFHFIARCPFLSVMLRRWFREKTLPRGEFVIILNEMNRSCLAKYASGDVEVNVFLDNGIELSTLEWRGSPVKYIYKQLLEHKGNHFITIGNTN